MCWKSRDKPRFRDFAFMTEKSHQSFAIANPHFQSALGKIEFDFLVHLSVGVAGGSNLDAQFRGFRVRRLESKFFDEVR